MEHSEKVAKMVKAWTQAKDKWQKWSLYKDYDRVITLLVELEKQGLSVIKSHK